MKKVAEVKNYPDIIKKIHNEFYGTPNVNKQKALELTELGFKSAKEAIDYSEWELYYSKKYSDKKFITELKAKNICAKYGLIIGQLSWFNGFVPQTAIDSIKQFSIDNDDLYACFTECRDVKYSDFPKKVIDKFNSGNYEKRGRWETVDIDKLLTYTSYTRIKKDMVIAAPLEQFNVPDGYEVSGNSFKKIVTADPIVLQEVKGGYFIVHAWGDESYDMDIKKEL